MTTKPRTRTPSQVRRWFRTNGITVAGWCRQHGYSRFVVFDLLRGKRVGNYGEAHRAAIALGLKPAPEGDA